jgi:hypothetical protein
MAVAASGTLIKAWTRGTGVVRSVSLATSQGIEPVNRVTFGKPCEAARAAACYR